MRDALRILLAISLVLLAGWLGYAVLFPTERVAPLLVSEVEGDVVRIDAVGNRTEATTGLALQRSDQIQSGEGGRATLSFGEENRIVLQRATSIRVLGISPAGVKIELDGGRVQATVRPGHGALGVVSGTREFSATDATFSVGTNGSGVLAVESERGEVQVLGVEGVTQLGPDQRLVGLSDGQVRVAPIPASLLLEVAWPDAARTREAEVMVRGRTDPGSEVRVGASGVWTVVVAGKDGQFQASVPLQEGQNPLEVVSEDPLGRTATSAGSILRDTRPPGASFEVRY